MPASAALVDTRSEYDGLFDGVYLPIAIAVAALVFAAVAFALVRYRARPGRDPSRRAHLNAVEALFAVGLAGIVAGLLVATLTTESKVDARSADPGTEIDVTAFQWGWRFRYENGAETVGNQDRPPVLVVPTDTVVRFDLTSADVIHSFWVPELRFKRDAFPKRTTSFDLVWSSGAGPQAGRCAEFCGISHAYMGFRVTPVSPAAFERFLARRSPSGGGSR